MLVVHDVTLDLTAQVGKPIWPPSLCAVSKHFRNKLQTFRVSHKPYRPGLEFFSESNQKPVPHSLYMSQGEGRSGSCNTYAHYLR